MKRFIRRPSPAMVVACTALFVSLGGVSYGVATGFIDSREIKNNTIRGKDVRNKALTGKEFKRDSVGGLTVNEGRLGTVPSAESLSHTAVVTAGGTFRRGRGVASVARRTARVAPRASHRRPDSRRRRSSPPRRRRQRPRRRSLP